MNAAKLMSLKYEVAKQGINVADLDGLPSRLQRLLLRAVQRELAKRKIK